MLSILGDVEAIFDETQTDGLNATLEDFYTQLNVLSLNAGEVEYSNLARSSAQKVTQTLNQYAEQLSVVRRQTVEEMKISVDDANTLLQKIDTINRSIQVATLQGSPTNELNDTRNLYLDKLSSYVNIQVTNHQDGSLSVRSGSTSLLDAGNHTIAALSLDDSADDVRLMADGTALSPSGGSLFGSMQLLNGRGSFAAAGENTFRGIPYYQSMLDSFASSLGETFNDLNGTGKPLFSGTTASGIAVSDEWLSDPNWITATTDPDVIEGKNDNILRMISALDQPQDITPGFSGSFSDFLLSTMGEVAVDTDYASDISETSDMVLSTVSNQRESVMGVSLNEETVNLLKYQKAFAASSRVMTALDEALEVVINRMGLVGR
jgi:flagellar hook-associated protein 1 FlgK